MAYPSKERSPYFLLLWASQKGNEFKLHHEIFKLDIKRYFQVERKESGLKINFLRRSLNVCHLNWVKPNAVCNFLSHVSFSAVTLLPLLFGLITNYSFIMMESLLCLNAFHSLLLICAKHTRNKIKMACASPVPFSLFFFVEIF